MVPQHVVYIYFFVFSARRVAGPKLLGTHLVPVGYLQSNLLGSRMLYNEPQFVNLKLNLNLYPKLFGFITVEFITICGSKVSSIPDSLYSN